MRRSEWGIRELAWETGFSVEKTRSILEDLSRNYLLELTSSKAIWRPADNPSKLRPWGWRLVHRLVVGSTQEAAKGYGPWSIVVAEYQILGRGRHGRRWYSSLGGLWTTIVLSLTPEYASLVPVASPVLLSRILRSQFSIDARIKWPNDIIVDGMKLAGILVEAEAFPDRFIVYIGIGVNVNNDPPTREAISIKNIKKELVARNKLLAQVIGWFSRYNKIVRDRESIMKEYIGLLDTLGKRVVLETRDGVIEGVVEDVEDDGSIVITTSSGKKVFKPSSVYKVWYVGETQTI